MTGFNDYGGKSNPCYKCADRKVTDNYNCHSDCPKYADFKDDLAETNRRIKEGKSFMVYHPKLNQAKKWKKGQNGKEKP